MMNIVQDIEQVVEEVAEDIGSWFSTEASAAEKLYDTLSDDEKAAATWAYGALAVINANLSSDGTLIVPLIQKAFPTLSLDNLQGFIDELLNGVKAAETPPLTLVEGINALTTYLKQFTSHTIWGQITQALGNILVTIISPETPIQKIASVAEIIYQVIVKPKVAALTPTPVAVTPTTIAQLGSNSVEEAPVVEQPDTLPIPAVETDTEEGPAA